MFDILTNWCAGAHTARGLLPIQLYLNLFLLSQKGS